MSKNINRNFTWLLQKIFHPSLVRKSQKFWEENHRKHMGKRGFVICNGPSLRISDLDKIENEISIASNKIYLAFEQTIWRPTMLTVADKILWKKIKLEIYNHYTPIIISSSFFDVPKPQETIFFPNLGYREDMTAFSPNVKKGVYGARTITFINLQIAVHLGLNPIYLIGCDHYYKNEENVDEKNRVTEHKGESNHFIKNYRLPGEKVNYAPIDIMTKGYEKARLYADSHGIQIYNATRGGHLEVFKRVDFDSLF